MHVSHAFFQGFAIGLVLFLVVLVVGHEVVSYFDNNDTY